MTSGKEVTVGSSNIDTEVLAFIRRLGAAFLGVRFD